MEAIINGENFEQRKKDILSEIDSHQSEINGLLTQYYTIYDCKYKSCEKNAGGHYVMLSGDDYDSTEGRHYYRYGCIKCQLNTGVLGYDGERFDEELSPMKHYFKNNYLIGKLHKLSFLNSSTKSLEEKFQLAVELFQEIDQNTPNDEIEEKMQEAYKKHRNRNRGPKNNNDGAA